jgi:hypothetical protein
MAVVVHFEMIGSSSGAEADSFLSKTGFPDHQQFPTSGADECYTAIEVHGVDNAGPANFVSDPSLFRFAVLHIILKLASVRV